MIVVAASYAIDASLEEGDDLFSAVDGPDVIAPTLFVDECANAIVNLVRRKRLRPEDSGRAIDLMLAIPTSLVRCEARNVILLAVRHHLTGYDATYLAVAVEHGAALATRDRGLARVAQATGAAVIGLWPSARSRGGVRQSSLAQPRTYCGCVG